MLGRLLCLLAVLALVAVPAASAATPRASFNDLEDEVMCDVCGVPLNIANSPRADQQRAELRQLIAQGLTKKQIEDRLVAQYGPGILATPPHHGFDLAAYLVPVAVVLACLVALGLALPRWRRRRRQADAEEVEQPALDPADARRLEEDLARFGA